MSKNKIYFLSSNNRKIEEIKKLWELYGIDHTYQILFLEDLKSKYPNINFQEPVEDGEDYLSNAKKKINYYGNLVNENIMTEDSGIEFSELNGAPGVHTKSWMPNKSMAEKNEWIVDNSCKWNTRDCKYHCAIVLLLNKNIYSFEGECFGKVDNKIINPDHAFAYDAIFFCNDLNKSFGFASIKEKSKFSHRGKAFKQLAKFLKK